MRLPYVEHDGKVQLLSQGDLGSEGPTLVISGREIVVIVQADLAQDRDPGVTRQAAETLLHLEPVVRGTVGMAADGDTAPGNRTFQAPLLQDLGGLDLPQLQLTESPFGILRHVGNSEDEIHPMDRTAGKGQGGVLQHIQMGMGIRHRSRKDRRLLDPTLGVME